MNKSLEILKSIYDDKALIENEKEKILEKGYTEEEYTKVKKKLLS